MDTYNEKIKELINNNEIDTAIKVLHMNLEAEPENDDAYFLLGNAYSKLNDWGMALNAYNQALTINPDSPAKIAQERLLEILNFYHHDLYNP